MSLAEAAFSNLKWVETEGPDPDQSEFTKLAAFLKASNSDQLLQKLVTICDERFSKKPNAPNEHEDDTEFLVTCHGSQEVFNVNYEGFWLISLLEAGGDQGGAQGGDQGGNQGGNQGGDQGGDQGGNQGGNQVKVNLESFKIASLGPFAFLGVWGDQEELIRYHLYI